MEVLLGSDTVATISQSTGYCGLNHSQSTTAFFPLHPGIGWRGFLFVLLFSKCFSPACKHNTSTHKHICIFSHIPLRDLRGRCYFCSHRRGGLTLQSGASGSPRSLPLPQRLGALGRRQELINDNAWSAGGEEPRLAREQRCRGGVVTVQQCYR